MVRGVGTEVGGEDGDVQERYRSHAGAIQEQWFWGGPGVGFIQAV